MSQNYFDCGLVLLLFALHFNGDFSHSPKPEKLLQLQLQLRWRRYDGVLLKLQQLRRVPCRIQRVILPGLLHLPFQRAARGSAAGNGEEAAVAFNRQ